MHRALVLLLAFGCQSGCQTGPSISDGGDLATPPVADLATATPDLPPGCPTSAPFDLTGAQLATCTESIVLSVGDRAVRRVSRDAVTWSRTHVDQSNCLTNADNTFNCGGSCDKKDPAKCTPFLDGLDCSEPDPADATKKICTGFDDIGLAAAVGRGVLVAASDFGIFASSDVGATWTKAAMPAPQQWGQGTHVPAAAFGNGFFLVLGDHFTFKSSDGVTWTKSVDDAAGGGYWGFGGLAFGNGHFIAVGGGVVKVTEDGVVWHDVLQNSDYKNIVFVEKDSVFVAVGKKGLRATSTDGKSWTVTAQDDCTSSSPEKCLGDLGIVASGGGKLFVCGDKCALSTDGVSWAVTKVWTYHKVSYVNNAFMDTDLRSTTDGNAWTAGTPLPAGEPGIGNIVTGAVLKGVLP